MRRPVQRAYVAGCRQSQPVAEAGGGMQSNGSWVQPRQGGPQGQGIVRGGLRDKTDSAANPLCRPRETSKCGLVIGHGDQPFHIVVCAFQPVGDARVGDL